MTIYVILCYIGAKCVKKVRLFEIEDAYKFIDNCKKDNKYDRMYLTTIEV